MINRLSIYCCLLYTITVNLFAGSIEETLPLIILDKHTREIRPGNRVLLYEDKTGSLDLEQIQSMPHLFVTSKKNTINAGSTSSVLWCMLKVRNLTDKEWYMEIGEPYVDFIDLYSFDEKGQAEHIETGLHRKFEQRLIRVNHFILPLNIPKDHEKVFYIKASSYTILKLPLVISTIQNHFEINHKEDLANGIYFGLIFALSLYNLFVFILLRDKTYLYYVLYINFLGATISWLRGYSPEFLNNIPLNINHGNTYAAITFIFLALFTHSFLNLDKTAPKHKWLIMIFFAISTANVITTMLGYFYVSFFFVLFIVFINLPYIAFFGIYALKKGFRPALFYLLGFTCFTLGDFIFMISENAKIEQSLLSDYSLQIGSSLEAIILSFALANKLNLYKKEKESTQAKALAQANEFSRELINTQEAERKRIAGELHDSVGQSLSLIKNRIALLKKDPQKETSYEELNDVVTNTIQEVRSITYGLRPFQLDLLGLTQSLKSLTEEVSESGEIKFLIKIDNIDGVFSKDEEINVFRIIQECLSNITRHSKASEAKLEIRNPSGRINIHIEDNGVGLDNKVNGHGFGIIGIKERVSILNGTLNITSNKPKGTRIEIQL